MKILYDLMIAPPKGSIQVGGSGLYGEAVFFALIKRTKNVIGVYDSKKYINKKILECGIRLYDVNEISIQKIVENENIDTFYTPLYNYSYQHYVQVKRFITTWHDIRDLEVSLSERFSYYSIGLKGEITRIIGPILKNLFERMHREKHKVVMDRLANIENAEYITDSEHSKYSIISFYPHLAKKNILVCYCPSVDYEHIELSQPKFEPKSYFLLTRCGSFVKNNLRAALAFDELFDERKDVDFKVVLTGVTNKKVYTRKLKNINRFIFFDNLDRSELISLQKNAYAFIFPSLNEGFGYPPIECMRYSVPVAASGISSIPEICQNAAIYFDPYKIIEIKNRILQLLNNDIYVEYSARAVEHYKVVNERQKQDLERIVNFILDENMSINGSKQ